MARGRRRATAAAEATASRLNSNANTRKPSTHEEEDDDVRSRSKRRAMTRKDMFDDVDEFMDDRLADDNDEQEDEEEPALPRRGGRQQMFELEGMEEEEEEGEEDEHYDPVDLGKFDDDDDGNVVPAEAAERAMGKAWGRRKGAYYAADTIDFELESDNEAAEQEEEEGKRLQAEAVSEIKSQVDEADTIMAMVAAQEEERKKGKSEGKSASEDAASKPPTAPASSDTALLRALDLELDGLDMDLGMDEDTSSSKTGKKKKKKAAEQSIVVESIAKDLDSVSEKSKLDMLMTSSPELLPLINDLNNRIKQLEEITAVWKSIKDKKDEIDTRYYCYVSLHFEVLCLYCTHASFYLSMKASGQEQLQQHPIMKTLLSLRQQLEQLEPMKNMLQDEAEEEQDDEEGEVDDEAAEQSEDEDENAAGLEDDSEGEDMDGMEDEDEDGADGMDDDMPATSLSSTLISRQSAQLSRLLSDITRPRASTKSSMNKGVDSVSAKLRDFGEVDHRQEMTKNITLGKSSGKLAALQAKLEMAKKKQEAVTEKMSRKRKVDSDGEQDDDGADSADDGDELSAPPSKRNKKTSAAAADDALAAYEQLKQKKAADKQARKEAFKANVVIPAPWSSLSEDERREISRTIKTNRGLTRSRPKDRKNPRTRNRLRYDKKVIARHGAVQEYKGSETLNYSGQQTGIKATVTKSISLK